MSNIFKDIYANLGIRPIINCQGLRTMLGGSRLSDELMEVVQMRFYFKKNNIMDMSVHSHPRVGSWCMSVMRTNVLQVI